MEHNEFLVHLERFLILNFRPTYLLFKHRHEHTANITVVISSNVFKNISVAQRIEMLFNSMKIYGLNTSIVTFEAFSGDEMEELIEHVPFSVTNPP